MKDVYFNELSVPSYDGDRIDALIDKYARVIKEALQQGFGKVRYDNGVESIMFDEQYSLAQYLNEHRSLQSVGVLLTTQAKPYIPDGDDAVDSYIQNDYVVEINGTQVKSEGFTSAAIQNSMAIGFENQHWTEESYSVIELANGDKIRTITILYAFDADFFVSETFQLWSGTNLPPVIQSSGLLPNEKNIKLSQHHGYDVLMRFAKHIRKEDYITEIVNSIDRNSNQKLFARGVQGTNFIDITLIKDDYYGLRVSTTARNDKELNHIVKLITEKYS